MGSLRVIVALGVIGVLVFLGVKLLPPYINNYELQDSIDNVARYATYAQAKTDDDVRKDVIAKAHEIGVELKEDQIAVSKDYQGCNIDINYTVRVDVPGHTFNLKFNPKAGNKLLTAK